LSVSQTYPSNTIGLCSKVFVKSISRAGQVTMRGMMGSNVLVNILKPVNIVNLGNTLRCGVGKSGLLNLSRPRAG